MHRSIPALLVTGALLSSASAAWAQAASPPPPTQATVPVPGFSTNDPRPGVPGGSPASSGSNVGSNVGAGATASPIGNDVNPPGATAPDVAQAPRTRPLFGLSRDLP